MTVHHASVRPPHPPHLRLRLGVAALVILAAVPGVVAARPTAVVSAPSAPSGVIQPTH